MFKHLVRLALSVLLIFAFVGCDSGGDDNGGNGNGNGNGNTVTATVDGQAFATDFVFTVASTGFGFTARDDDRTILITLLAETLPPATYDIGQGTEPVEYLASASFVRGDASDDPQNNVYNAGTMSGSGSITVASYSPDGASGTFSFEAVNGNGDRVNVTGGQFDVDF